MSAIAIFDWINESSHYEELREALADPRVCVQLPAGLLL